MTALVLVHINLALKHINSYWRYLLKIYTLHAGSTSSEIDSLKNRKRSIWTEEDSLSYTKLRITWASYHGEGSWTGWHSYPKANITCAENVADKWCKSGYFWTQWSGSPRAASSHWSQPLFAACLCSRLHSWQLHLTAIQCVSQVGLLIFTLHWLPSGHDLQCACELCMFLTSACLESLNVAETLLSSFIATSQSFIEGKASSLPTKKACHFNWLWIHSFEDHLTLL